MASGVRSANAWFLRNVVIITGQFQEQQPRNISTGTACSTGMEIRNADFKLMDSRSLPSDCPPYFHANSGVGRV